MDDQSTHEQIPAAPQPPHLPVRPSVTYLVVGNIALVAFLALYVRHMIPGWIIVTLDIILFIALSIRADNHRSASEESFSDARTTELLPSCEGDRQKAHLQALIEFDSQFSALPIIRVVAAPAFLITFVLSYLVFVDLYYAFGNLHWIINATLSTLLTSFAWVLFLCLWNVANLTPAQLSIDYSQLRKDEHEANQFGEEDKNDIIIIRQAVELESVHRRIETYTLESALLSALSFSSFMAIVLSERNYVADLRRTFSTGLPWHDFSAANASDLSALMALVFAYLGANMIGLISLSLLFCATTFLGVLVARLRFNDGYRDADRLLKTAARLNEKEDQAVEQNKADRVALYSRYIRESLDQAAKLERGLIATVMFMKLSRNAGIFCFTLSLILCGLFFDRSVSVVIALLFVGALLFGFIDQLARHVLRRRVLTGGAISHLLGSFKRGSKRGK